MDVVNFPAILAQYGLLKPGDVITYDDLILIGKKVNDKRNGSQYQELAMTIQDFLSGAVAIPASDYYVDANFGNDATALPNRLDKPYATINAALNAAQGFPPATVYVRAGIYSEGFIQMRNNIKIYCEPGVEIRDTVISDAGTDISMGWYGKADLTGTSYVTATGFTNLTFEFNTVDTTRTFLLTNPTAGKIVRMKVSGKKVYTDGSFGFGSSFRGQTEGVVTVEESFSSKAGNGTLFFRGGAASYSGDVTIICPKIIQEGSSGTAMTVSESATDLCKVKIIGDLINTISSLGPYNATIFCRRGKIEIYGDVIATNDNVIPVIIDGGFNVGAGYVNIYGDVKVEDGTAAFVSHRFVPLYVQGGLIQGGSNGQYGKGVIIVGNSLPGLPGNPDVWCYVKDCRVLKGSGADTIVELTGNVDSDHRILAYNTEFQFPAPGGGPVCVTATGPRTPGFVHCVANGTIGGGMTDLFVPSGFTTINNLIIPRF